MPSKMRTASWILLTVAGSLVLLGGLVSANIGYTSDYLIGSVPVADVAAGRAPVLTALRGIRGTAAAYAAGFAVLFLAIAAGPYRRGDAWAWWSLLAGTAVLVLVAFVRVPLLGLPFGQGGSGPPLVLGGIVLLGLLLDVGRLRT
jgi:hypothetical protein